MGFGKQELHGFRKVFASVLVWGIVLALAIPAGKQLLSILLQNTAFYAVSGNSMYPTYHDGQIVHTQARTVQRGDVIVGGLPPAAAARNPDYAEKTIIKRVIGLPGDRIDIVEDSTVTVNGVILAEDYLTAEAKASTFLAGKTDYASLTLEPGEYYVMGDNRGRSYDSRRFGPLPGDRITGVVTEGEKDAVLLKRFVQLLVIVLLLPKLLGWVIYPLVSLLP